MHEYQKNRRFFAQAPGMMEEICKEELIELGAKNTEIAYRGIYFEADNKTLYNINYNSRLISRVLAPLVSFPCDRSAIILDVAQTIRWEKFFNLKQTFSITASVANSTITNSLYAAQCLKDGIADYFRSKYGSRPDINVQNPDVRFNVHIEDNHAIISLDTSGESLHKRGYRLLAGEAPMQETLAAAIIRLSKWDGAKPLWDPMCGSGTILAEALMHYCRMPAQYLRKNFGFFYMPDYEPAVWENVKKESDAQIRPLTHGLIYGSDISDTAVGVAKDNLSRLPFSDAIDVQCQAFQFVSQFENGTIIVNPPYGIRLGELEEVQVLYKQLGDFLKRNCKGTSAFIFTGNKPLQKAIGLRVNKRTPLVNGKFEGFLLQIDSYEGSKKAKWQRNADGAAQGSADPNSSVS
jgi:putative N6-adenine-specific DNA methylase